MLSGKCHITLGPRESGDKHGTGIRKIIPGSQAADNISNHPYKIGWISHRVQEPRLHQEETMDLTGR